MGQVQFTDEFWSPRIEINRTSTLPQCFRQCEETGRIKNFEVAGRLAEGKFEGIYFNDSDVYKVVEGAAHILATQPNSKQKKRQQEKNEKSGKKKQRIKDQKGQ